MTCLRCGHPRKYHPGCSGFLLTGAVFIGWHEELALYNVREEPGGDVNTWSQQTLEKKGIAHEPPPEKK